MSDSLIPDAEVSTETTETSTQTETTETQTTTTDTGEVKSFMYADGVLGEGDAPEWFKADKYKTVGDQAKAYVDLESRFGSFTGAPKDGNYEIEGVDFKENPLMGVVAEWGKDNQLSNEGLAGLVEKVNELAQKQIDEDVASTKDALGPDADKRISNIVQWGQNNLTAEEYQALQGVATNAKSVEVIEKLISMSKNSKLVNADAVVKDVKNLEEEYKAALLKVDVNGRREMENPEYRQKVTQMAKELEEARKK
jgi:hypothetical protein